MRPLDGHAAGEHHRPGGEQAGDRRREDARRERDDHEHEDDQRRPGATAERCGLTTHGVRRIDHDDSGSARLASRASQSPCSSSTSPTSSTMSPFSRCSPARCTARMTRSPLSVTMPGNTVAPTNADRGGTSTSATPGSASSRVGSAASVQQSGVVAQQNAGLVAEVARHRRRRAVGDDEALQQEHEQHRSDDDRQRRRRRSRRIRTDAPSPSSAYSEASTLTGLPVRVSSEPACAPKASGSSSFDGRDEDARRDDHDDGQQCGDGAVHADEGREHGHDDHDEHREPAQRRHHRGAPAAGRPTR